MEGLIGSERVRRAEARREREADEWTHHEEAKVDAQAAPTPEQSRSRAPSHSGEDDAARPPETGGEDDDDEPPPKRPRVPPAGSSSEDYTSWMRENRKRKREDEDNDDDDDTPSTREGLRILSAVLRGVDVMEVYSPPRVVEVCRKYWLEPCEGLDLKTGWDLSKKGEQRRARDLIRPRAPYLIICSPPCTKFSNLQNLNKAINGPEWHEKFAEELKEAEAHVRFCCELMREQLAAGRHFLFEHPAWAASWKMPELDELSRVPEVLWQRADQCMYGLVTPNDAGISTPAMKPTGFLSSSWCILEELSLRCDHSHPHQQLVGGRAAAAALYPPALCKAICKGLVRQRAYDKSGLVGGRQFGRKELKSMLRKLKQNINKCGSDMGDDPAVDNAGCNDGDDDTTADLGSQEASSHLADEPGVGETPRICESSRRQWSDHKHEPDGSSPEHIDLEANRHLGDDDKRENGEEEIGDEFFKMNITDATAKTAALKAVKTRAARFSDKHREARSKRAELRSLAQGDATGGYFKTGFNKGADILRKAVCALHGGWHRRCVGRRTTRRHGGGGCQETRA